MRSIERRFQKIQNKQPGWSTYVCFSEAITGQKFTSKKIAEWFNRLVDKNDYSKSEKKAIMLHLYKLSNGTEEGAK